MLKNLLWHHRKKKTFKNTFKYIFLNCSNILQYYCFYSIFKQINAVLASIRDFFWKLFKNLIWPNFWVPVCKYHYMKVENIFFYNADFEVEESINKQTLWVTCIFRADIYEGWCYFWLWMSLNLFLFKWKPTGLYDWNIKTDSKLCSEHSFDKWRHVAVTFWACANLQFLDIAHC